MLRCIREVWRRSSKIGNFSLLLFSVIYIYSFLLIFLRDELTPGFWRDTVFLTYAYWIPIGVAVISIRDKKILYDTFLKWSYLISILLFLCVFFRRTTDLMEGETEYNMFFGFHLVPFALFHITDFYKSKKILILVFFLFEVLLLIIYANRGALIPLIFYFVFRILLKQTSFQKRIANVLLIAVFSILLVVLSKPIISGLANISDVMGIKSRNLTMVAYGEATNSSGRDELADISLDMIKERPVLGWGLGGEFCEIARRMGFVKSKDSISSAFSPHNGILELLVCLGVLWGTIAIIIFVIPLFNLGRIKDPYEALLILIFGAAVVIPCFISADGLLIKPGAAIYAYLYYARKLK